MNWVPVKHARKLEKAYMFYRSSDITDCPAQLFYNSTTTRSILGDVSYDIFMRCHHSLDHLNCASCWLIAQDSGTQRLPVTGDLNLKI